MRNSIKTTLSPIINIGKFYYYFRYNYPLLRFGGGGGDGIDVFNFGAGFFALVVIKS